MRVGCIVVVIACALAGPACKRVARREAEPFSAVAPTPRASEETVTVVEQPPPAPLLPPVPPASPPARPRRAARAPEPLPPSDPLAVDIDHAMGDIVPEPRNPFAAQRAP